MGLFGVGNGVYNRFFLMTGVGNGVGLVSSKGTILDPQRIYSAMCPKKIWVYFYPWSFGLRAKQYERTLTLR